MEKPRIVVYSVRSSAASPARLQPATRRSAVVDNIFSRDLLTCFSRTTKIWLFVCCQTSFRCHKPVYKCNVYVSVYDRCAFEMIIFRHGFTLFCLVFIVECKLLHYILILLYIKRHIHILYRAYVYNYHREGFNLRSRSIVPLACQSFLYSNTLRNYFLIYQI